MHDHQHNKIIYDDDEVAESEYRNNQPILFVLSWKIRRTGDVATVDIIDMEMLAVCPYDKGINILWVMVSNTSIGRTRHRPRSGGGLGLDNPVLGTVTLNNRSTL